MSDPKIRINKPCTDTRIKEHFSQTITVCSAGIYCLDYSRGLPCLCCLFFPAKDFLPLPFPDRH